jgi:hypothetical protein|tara:strand:+ start:512 stop:1147 length:636 start_codon:yes stop_codon:yes gene_type:complete
MKKVDLGEWHSKFRPDYDPKLIFQNCTDRESALFALSLYVLFESVTLTNQPFRKKTGQFFIDLQKKYFKNKYNENILSERNILAYSLLIVIRGLLNVEKLSKKDLRKLILFAVGHYSAMLARDDDEMKELANHVLKTFESEYWLIKPNSTGTRNIILNKLYKSFDLNIDNEKKNRKNISLLGTSAHTALMFFDNVPALAQYTDFIKKIKKS